MKRKIRKYSLVKSAILGLCFAFLANDWGSDAVELVNSSESASVNLEKELDQIAQSEIRRPIDLSNPTGIDSDSENSEQPSLPSDEPTKSSDDSKGLGEKFEGIWGLSEESCVRTLKIEDILDNQTLAIKGNRIYFIDSQCLILESEGDYQLGQTAKVSCIDVDGQSIETELKFRPIGALKLEISSNLQNSRQYYYCAGIPD